MRERCIRHFVGKRMRESSAVFQWSKMLRNNEFFRVLGWQRGMSVRESSVAYDYWIIFGFLFSENLDFLFYCSRIKSLLLLYLLLAESKSVSAKF